MKDTSFEQKNNNIVIRKRSFHPLAKENYTSLQRLAANEVAPPSDLGGDALGLGELDAHALSEEDGGLGLHEERHAEVDGVAAHDIVFVDHAAGTTLGQVEGATDVVLLKDLAEGTLVLLGELDDLDLDGAVLAGLLEVTLDILVGGVELVAERVEVVHDLGEVGGSGVTAEEETLTGLWQAEVHLTLDADPVGLDEILTESGHLTSGRHLDTEVGVGTGKTSPGELRNLDSQVVTVNLHEVDGLGDVGVGDGASGDINEVGTENLGGEGERTGGTEVALDDLEQALAAFRVVGVDDLHVEGTGNVPGLGDLLSDDLDTLDGGGRKVGRGEDERGISRVNTGVLDVLTDGVNKQLAVRGNSVDVDLAGALNELGDDNRVVRRDAGGGKKLVLKLSLGPDDGHGSAGQNVRRANEDRVLDAVSELLSVLVRGKLLPGRLVNTNGVEDRRELVSVLSLVDVERVSTQDVGLASFLELQSDVLGQLAADRDDNTRGVLKLVNVHHTLVAELFEVEAVGEVVVCGGSVSLRFERSGIEGLYIPVDVVSGLYYVAFWLA